MSASQRVYVVDGGDDCVRVFDLDGSYIRRIGTAGFEDGQFSDPLGIAVSPTGDVYVADSRNHRIQVFHGVRVYVVAVVVVVVCGQARAGVWCE